MRMRIFLLCIICVMVPVLAWADGDVTEYEPATISAEDTWTDALSVQAGQAVNVSIYDCNATNSMTIILQRKFYEETEWRHEIDDWVLLNQIKDIENTAKASAEFCYWRIGCPSGNYTSGVCKVRIGRSK